MPNTTRISVAQAMDPPRPGDPSYSGPRDYAFWRRHPGLVWSNSHASDEIMIANALLRLSFHLLLDVAVRFGTPRMRSIWEKLVKDETEETKRAAPTVDRCLHNIEKGFGCSPQSK